MAEQKCTSLGISNPYKEQLGKEWVFDRKIFFYTTVLFIQQLMHIHVFFVLQSKIGYRNKKPLIFTNVVVSVAILVARISGSGLVFMKNSFIMN